ncbi:MAG: hypothetical protein ABMA02_13865 [Saprospiraceae bacterium]
MLVKASSITNLTDARYFAAKEVAFLGFALEESTDGYLDPMYMKAIREWVHGPKIVGEFDRAPAPYVREAAAFFGLDAVQVTNPDVLPGLQDIETILCVLGTDDAASIEPLLQQNKPFVTYFLLDFSMPGLSATLLGTQADAWKNLFARFPVLLDISLPTENLPGMLQALRPAGLALRGGAEERVGIKSFDEVDAIFDCLDT